MFKHDRAVLKSPQISLLKCNEDFRKKSNKLNVALRSSTATLRTVQSIEDYEAGVEASSQAFYSSRNKTVSQIPFIAVGAIIAKTPIHPIINAGAILATGILAAKFMLNVNRTITAAIILTNKSLKPFEFITLTSQNIHSSGIEKVSNLTSQNIYNSGVESDLDIQAKYRSLINSDSNNSGSTINTIVENYNYFKDKYNGFVSELPAIFKPSYIMPSLKNIYNSTTRSIYNKYVSITNISNPKVTLQQINQADGSVKIKAITTETTDQTFTYDVNYTNTNFASGLTKIVDAKVIANVDECTQGIITAQIINNIQLDCNSSNRVSILISFTANGSGILYSGSYYGAADIDYPVKLYTDNAMGYNSYSVRLKSGNVNEGVLEINISFAGDCISGKTPRESLDNYYSWVNNWQVKLMNRCGQYSSVVSF